MHMIDVHIKRPEEILHHSFFNFHFSRGFKHDLGIGIHRWNLDELDLKRPVPRLQARRKMSLSTSRTQSSISLISPALRPTWWQWMGISDSRVTSADDSSAFFAKLAEQGRRFRSNHVQFQPSFLSAGVMAG